MIAAPSIEMELAAQANILSQRVSTITGMSQSLIYSRLKPTPVVRARWAIWYVLRAIRGWPSTALGAHFGVEHATIIHGVDRATALIESDTNFCNLITNIKQP